MRALGLDGGPASHDQFDARQQTVDECREAAGIKIGADGDEQGKNEESATLCAPSIRIGRQIRALNPRTRQRRATRQWLVFHASDMRCVDRVKKGEMMSVAFMSKPWRRCRTAENSGENSVIPYAANLWPKDNLVTPAIKTIGAHSTVTGSADSKMASLAGRKISGF